MERAKRSALEVEEPGAPLRKIPYEDFFTPAEWDRLGRGLIPQAMEDKWIVFAEDDTIFLHRSWTGAFVYKATVSLSEDGARVVNAERGDWAEVAGEDDAYHARMLHFLLRGLVLRQDVRFPMPARHVPDDGEGDSVWIRLARRLGVR